MILQPSSQLTFPPGGVRVGEGRAGGALLPFSDNFERGDGAVANGWSGDTWTLESGVALNTPTLGSELITNPGFEGTYVAGVSPNWTKSGSGTATEENAVIHGGAAAQKLVTAAGFEGMNSAALTITLGAWYQFYAWMQGSGGNGSIVFGNSRLNASVAKALTGAFVQHLATSRGLTAGTDNMRPRANTSGSTIYLDDASFKTISLPSLFLTRDVQQANVIAQVIITVAPSGVQAGHVLNIDSVASPLNFVLAYLDTTNAYLVKCVGGTYTQVISGAITFGSTKNLKVIKTGNDYSLYYGTPGSETQIGATTAIANMTGTIHGLFSTNSVPRFDTYQLAANP